MAGRFDELLDHNGNYIKLRFDAKAPLYSEACKSDITKDMNLNELCAVKWFVKVSAYPLIEMVGIFMCRPEHRYAGVPGGFMTEIMNEILTIEKTYVCQEQIGYMDMEG